MLDRNPSKAASNINHHLFQSLSQDASRNIAQSIGAAFSALLDHSPQLVWLVGPDGVLLKANQTALAFGRVKAEQVVGQHVVETAEWPFFSQTQERLRAAMTAAANGQVISYEVDVPLSGEQQTAIRLTVRSIEEPGGEPGELAGESGGENPMLLVIEGVDISALKQAESSLLRCQRLNSLDDLTVGLVHDFKNLLTPLLAIATLLRIEFPEADHSQRELFRIIATNTHRANVLLRQMLSFVKGGNEKCVPMKVDSLILDIQALIRPTFPSSISIETTLPSGLWPAEIKENQMHQVLMNLCLNARDAMPQGGVLKLSAESFTFDQSDVSNDMAVVETAIAHYIVIQISDTGVGIPAKILDKVFNPFFTTKPASKGAGLGLSTAMDIVTSHGGFIDVSSGEDEGTQFRVFLPALV